MEYNRHRFSDLLAIARNNTIVNHVMTLHFREGITEEETMIMIIKVLVEHSDELQKIIVSSAMNSTTIQPFRITP